MLLARPLASRPCSSPRNRTWRPWPKRRADVLYCEPTPDGGRYPDPGHAGRRCGTGDAARVPGGFLGRYSTGKVSRPARVTSGPAPYRRSSLKPMSRPCPCTSASEIHSSANGSNSRAWESGPASIDSKPSSSTSGFTIRLAPASSPQ